MRSRCGTPSSARPVCWTAVDGNRATRGCRRAMTSSLGERMGGMKRLRPGSARLSRAPIRWITWQCRRLHRGAISDLDGTLKASLRMAHAERKRALGCTDQVHCGPGRRRRTRGALRRSRSSSPGGPTVSLEEFPERGHYLSRKPGGGCRSDPAPTNRPVPTLSVREGPGTPTTL